MLGVAVFVIWVAPDILFPAYRQHWLFQNSILGQISNKVPGEVLTSPVVLWSRIIRAVVLVPILEELFWRAWLMRWIISPRFQEVKLGTYTSGGVLDHRGSIRIRTWLLLGRRADCRNCVQLVDDSDQEPGRLHPGACGHQCVFVLVCGGDQALGILDLVGQAPSPAPDPRSGSLPCRT